MALFYSVEQENLLLYIQTVSKVNLDYQRNYILLFAIHSEFCVCTRYSESLLIPLSRVDHFARLSINTGIDASDNMNLNEKRILDLEKLIEHLNLRYTQVVKKLNRGRLYYLQCTVHQILFDKQCFFMNFYLNLKR